MSQFEGSRTRGSRSQDSHSSSQPPVSPKNQDIIQATFADPSSKKFSESRELDLKIKSALETLVSLTGNRMGIQGEERERQILGATSFLRELSRDNPAKFFLAVSEACSSSTIGLDSHSNPKVPLIRDVLSFLIKEDWEMSFEARTDLCVAALNVARHDGDFVRMLINKTDSKHMSLLELLHAECVKHQERVHSLWDSENDMILSDDVVDPPVRASKIRESAVSRIEIESLVEPFEELLRLLSVDPGEVIFSKGCSLEVR